MDPTALPPVELTIDVPVDAALAWRYLTDPDRVAEWFTEASPVGPEGAPYRLDFGDGSVVDGRIVALEPGRRLAYSWAWTDAEPRLETLVTWTIEPLPGGGCRISLEHSGWSEAGADESLRDDHESYWSGYLDDLKALLEEAAAT